MLIRSAQTGRNRVARSRACSLGVVVVALTNAMAFAQPTPPMNRALGSSLDSENSRYTGQGLTIEQAVMHAGARSRALVSQAERARAAQENAIAAGQRPDPVGRIAIENLPIDGPAAWSLSRDFMTMRSIGISQELTRGATLTARRDRFERAAEVAVAAGELELTELASATARAWLHRYFRQQLVELLREQRREVRLQIDAADASYRSGLGRQTEVFAARAAVAVLDERIDAAQSSLATARISLARWIGTAEDAPLADPPSITSSRISQPVPDDHALPDTPASVRPPSDATLPPRPLLDHPALSVLERQIAAARADAELAHAERDPDWRIGLSYSQRGPSFSNMASINLSLPLPWDRANRQDRKLAAAHATVNAREAERDELARRYDAQTRGWLQDWRSGLERLSRYDHQLLPLADERTVAALVDYRAGTGPLESVLAARRAEVELRIQRLDLESETADLWARLQYLMPSDALGRPPSPGDIYEGVSR